MFYTVNKKTSEVLGKYSGNYYATAVLLGMKTLEDLADHMAAHNGNFSKGTIIGVLTDMVSCVKELALEGYSVKLSDLAIISASLVNKTGGLSTLDNFNINQLVTGVKMCAQATGSFTKSQLSKDFTLSHWKKATDALGSDDTTTDGGGSTSGDSGSSDSDDGGGTGLGE